MSNLEVPKYNGIELCLKYHVEGKCKSSCSRAKSHVNLDQPTLINLRKFVKSVKDNYKSFRAKCKRDNDSSEPQTEGKTDES